MRAFFAVFSVVLQILGTHSLVIPDELPSLLSVVYSNIPTIQKGTDSRIGWGFRLGNRADFQVLVELGPQKNTRPIRVISGPGGSKRDAGNSFRDSLYAQQHHNKKQISDTEGGKWINQWSQSMNKLQPTADLEAEPRPGLGIGEIDAKSVIPDDATLTLQNLYRKKEESGQQAKKSRQEEKESEQNETDVVKVTTQKPTTTTSAKDALDNVEVEDK